jgi:ssDNA-binding replication factor A large subunit
MRCVQSSASSARGAAAPGSLHANGGLALARRRAERKDCDEANTRRIREEHDAAHDLLEASATNELSKQVLVVSANSPYRRRTTIRRGSVMSSIA